MIKSRFLILIISILILNSCLEEIINTTETNIKGRVKNIQNEFIYPAYIFLEDTLLTTTDEYGEFQIPSLKSGTYSLLCSSVNYSDKTIVVDVTEGQITNTEILLTADESVGWLIGEFQDKMLYEENVTSNPIKTGWSSKEVLDGVSGATIQTWKLSGVPESEIYLGGDLISTADDYGQYGFELQCGTYPFTGSCMGYTDTCLIIKIEPDSDFYFNFILSKE